MVMARSLKLVTPEGSSPGALNSRDPHDRGSRGRGYGQGQAFWKHWRAGVGSRLRATAAGAERPHPQAICLASPDLWW